MIKNNLAHNSNIEIRSQLILNNIKSKKKLQHKMINSAPDFLKIHNLYLNSLIEWYSNPKCEICLSSKGVLYNNGEH